VTEQPPSNSNFPIHWEGAVLGGSVAIAGGAFFGTLVAAISLRMTIAAGSSAEQAYSALATGTSWTSTILSALLTLAACFSGGYVAAKLAGSRPLVQAAAASLFPLLFTAVMYLNPASQPGPFWYIAYSVVSPVVASVVGGYVYAKQI
jgi:hypothetical protein